MLRAFTSGIKKVVAKLNARTETPYETATNVERLEYLADQVGRQIFLDQPLRIDRFGTLKDPILVDSNLTDHGRIVGCTGFPKDSHELWWFEVGPLGTKREMRRCPECGQAFRINQVPGSRTLAEMEH